MGECVFAACSFVFDDETTFEFVNFSFKNVTLILISLEENKSSCQYCIFISHPWKGFIKF